MKVTTTATEYTVCALPEDNARHQWYAIIVVYRGRGLWAVCRGGKCLDLHGEWHWCVWADCRGSDYVDWLSAEETDQHLHDLDSALRLAQEAAPKVVVNGITVEQALSRAGGDR